MCHVATERGTVRGAWACLGLLWGRVPRVFAGRVWFIIFGLTTCTGLHQHLCSLRESSCCLLPVYVSRLQLRLGGVFARRRHLLRAPSPHPPLGELFRDSLGASRPGTSDQRAPALLCAAVTCNDSFWRAAQFIHIRARLGALRLPRQGQPSPPHDARGATTAPPRASVRLKLSFIKNHPSFWTRFRSDGFKPCSTSQRRAAA
jgi:hypothetical protein